ncbi:homocitrate synthase mitochondrial precursor [Dactylonectria estremocensis]|uniref:Homocitrate synthase mitochondrial n=1 Tax=Dactylonectria estremocensis TaxID=1079267 RepID=A0A9P9JBF2_9HYPO|nr:homocitrate synthase mitochondrial precursor [Dactylonectria estremocensis]
MQRELIDVFTRVGGVDHVIGTCQQLREYSYGNDIEVIKKTAIEVVQYAKSQGVEVRFSSEDSFRSDLVDLLDIYRTIDRIGANRLGVADTVGSATPRQVSDFVRTLQGAGGTHIDISVLGIGERNDITPLGGLMARMIVSSPDYVTSRYKLKKIKAIEDYAAEQVPICAFNHKSGILKPEGFGLDRYVSFASRLTGWNATKSRVEQLGLTMTDDQVKLVQVYLCCTLLTVKIKQMADVRPLAINHTDSIIRSFHLELETE